MDKKGTIKKLFVKDGYGFLTVEGRNKDLFFHATGMVSGHSFKILEIGQEVVFNDIITNSKGECAIGVKLAY